MPRGDGTGPGGMGPMTGRAAGYCAGYPVPGYMNPMGGRGMGRGGGGWGRRNMYWATGLTGWQRAQMGMPSAYGPAWGAPVPGALPPTAAWGAYAPPAVAPDQEKSFLKQQVDYLEGQMRDAKERLKQLEEEESSS